MKPVILPPQDTLLSLLDYSPETGLLKWKSRPELKFGDSSWNATYSGKPALNSMNRLGYNAGSLNRKAVLAHRVIWKLWHGEDPQEIDHINGIRSDNRISNLRSVDRGENMKNKKTRKDSPLGLTGISTRNGKFRAVIRNNGTLHYLGTFPNIDDAIEVRNAASLRFNFHPNHSSARPEYKNYNKKP